MKGQPIQRIVITEVSVSTPSGSSSARRNKVISSYPTHAPPNKSGKGSKSKVPQLTSAQKLKAKIEAEKHSKKSSEDDIWWKPKLKEIEATSDIKGRLDKVNLLLRGKRAENGWLAVEVSLYQLHLTILAWLADEQGEAESACEEYIVRILRSIHQLREHPSLFPAASHILAQVLMALGFDSITPPTAKVQEERELSFKFVKLMKSKSGKPLHPQLRIRVSPSEFLLKAYGAYMDRSMDSKPDHRVGFEPDGWQRQVRLVIVSAHEGLLTSLGRCWTKLIITSLCSWLHPHPLAKHFLPSTQWKRCCVKVMMELLCTSHQPKRSASKVSSCYSNYISLRSPLYLSCCRCLCTL